MQKHKQLNKDETAVSPVIGVILMVAITVILAGVVFLLVNKLTTNTQHTPVSLSLTQTTNSQTGVVYSVVSSSESVTWNDLTVKLNGTTLNIVHSGANTAIIGGGDTISINGLTTGKVYVFDFIIKGELVTSQTYRA